MCLLFLAGDCRFGSSVCAYAHEKTYLPAGGRRWWDDERKCLVIRHALRVLHPDEYAKFIPELFGLLNNRFIWASCSRDTVELVVGQSSEAKERFRDAFDAGMTMAGLGLGGPT